MESNCWAHARRDVLENCGAYLGYERRKEGIEGMWDRYLGENNTGNLVAAIETRLEI